jgi:hypothetical protein
MGDYKLSYTGKEVDNLLKKVEDLSEGGGGSGGSVNCPFDGDVSEAANVAINAYAKQVTEETIDKALEATY